MSDLRSLLPPNRTRLEAALSATLAPQVAPDVLRSLLIAADCPANILPWLAWERRVDGWEYAITEADQRALIRDSIELHRHKGTAWAVETALAKLGYPGSETVEHGQTARAWADAGGELLDGVGNIDGTSTLAIPDGYRYRFTTHHWAEYAIRINLVEGPWSRSRQREVMRVARAYAPMRSHLTALITAMRIEFDSPVRIAAVSGRLRGRMDRCRRFPVPSFDTLDGCGLLDGDSVASLLDGAGMLDGYDSLAGTTPAGEPLDGGQWGYTQRLTSRIALRAAGGNRTDRGDLDGGAGRLDGKPLVGELLDGLSAIDGVGVLDYPTLSSSEDTLDGRDFLGDIPGPDGVWFSARITLRRGTLITTETLQ